MQDLNQNILLHQDIGFGPKVIDYERKIEYNTLAKEAIRIKLLNETLSEEMRLLYVALTRAKEKLIISGCEKNIEKSMLNKENAILNSENKISIANIRKCKTYLDWIELVYLKEKEKLKQILELNVYDKNKINANNLENKKEMSYMQEIEKWSKKTKQESINKINKLLNWKYEYEESTKIEGKESVSNIAKGAKREIIEIINKPKFVNKTEKLNKAEIGTLMHLIMQKLDFKENYNKIKINELIQKLIKDKIITENQSKYINIDKIIKFTNSNIYKELQNAKQIYKEQPFYIYLSANEIYNNGLKEKILVQGIIDLYYINKNDELILLDYKTDYVNNNNEQELINKYKGQLNIYKRALEQALGKKVEAVYIYSIYLNKEILLDLLKN